MAEVLVTPTPQLALPPEARTTLLDALRAMGLVGPDARPELIPLTGGVSSLIARVEDGPRVFCVKQALETLRVAAEWHVPVDRNRAEVAWMREAALTAPDSVPEILGEDPARNVFAMAYLEPRRYPVWKDELIAGRVSEAFAGAVGRELGRIHAATADREDLARRFATDSNFHALRLEPYLGATGRVHRDLEGSLQHLSARTAATRRVLVHGDVSPKNILVRRDTPVFLDAECAWYGEPAFDLAFCANHLVLKAARDPKLVGSLRAAFKALSAAYLAQVPWEDPRHLEERAAALLPALALARIDGKSPVEDLAEMARSAVRSTARDLVESPPRSLAELFDRWEEMQP